MDETLLATAILSGPDAIISANRAGVITFWNASAERIFGFTEKQALGQSLDLIIPERFRARYLPALIFLMILFPVLLPAVDAIKRAYQQNRPAILAPRGFAVPAAA
jgi:PAS domain-containing protein